MQRPRWNNCKNPRTRGKTAQPSISHSGQGLEGKKSSSLPVEGGIFSLTFPFIDQAITRFDHWSLSAIEIFHQLGSGVPVNRSQNLNCFIDWTGGVSWARASLGCCRQQ